LSTGKTKEIKMKDLELRRNETNRKDGRYLYEVIEDGKVLCIRRSNRIYVACYVEDYRGKTPNTFKHATAEDYKSLNENGTMKSKIEFDGTYFFGRMNLIGKGASKCSFIGIDPTVIMPDKRYRTYPREPYGLAVIKNPSTFRLWDTKEKSYFNETFPTKLNARDFRDAWLDKGNYPDEPTSVISIHEFKDGKFIGEVD
jgi:hypothetical protein